MVSYTPPNEILSIFNSENFHSQGNDDMSQDQADLRYLRKIGGTVTGGLRVKGAMQMDSTVSADTDRIYVDSTNNRVGINRVPTTYPLEIGGDVQVNDGKLYVKNNTSHPEILMNGTSTAFGILSWTDNNLLTKARVFAGAGTNILNFDNTMTGYQFNQNNIEKVKFNSNGDILTQGSYIRVGTGSASYTPLVSSTGVKIQYGKSNDTNNTGSITFGYTFTSTPFVICQMEANVANSLYVININAVSTTGFNWRKQYQQGGSSFGAGTEQFWWIAIGV